MGASLPFLTEYNKERMELNAVSTFWHLDDLTSLVSFCEPF